MRQSNKVIAVMALIVSLLLLPTTSVMAGSSSITKISKVAVPKMVSLTSLPVSTVAFQAKRSGKQLCVTRHCKQKQWLLHHPRPRLGTFERLRLRIPTWFLQGISRLGECENSGSYATVRFNGFYGRYQFDLKTWRSLGYHNDPASATPAQQDWAAWRLYQDRGTQPWPECGYRLA